LLAQPAIRALNATTAKTFAVIRLKNEFWFICFLLLLLFKPCVWGVILRAVPRGARNFSPHVPIIHPGKTRANGKSHPALRLAFGMIHVMIWMLVEAMTH
jgi:hypothetical protein